MYENVTRESCILYSNTNNILYIFWDILCFMTWAVTNLPPVLVCLFWTLFCVVWLSSFCWDDTLKFVSGCHIPYKCLPHPECLFISKWACILLGIAAGNLGKVWCRHVFSWVACLKGKCCFTVYSAFNLDCLHCGWSPISRAEDSGFSSC